MKKLIRIAIFVFALITSGAAYAQDRVALLIANSDYGSHKLTRAKKNVEQLATVLKEAGFSVTVKENVGKTLRKDIEAFALSCPDGGVSLFYFAGFGNRFQQKHGKTITQPDGTKKKTQWLEWTTGIQPVGAGPERSYPLPDIARTYRDRSRARLHLFFFDCAYKNPMVTKPQWQGMGQVKVADFPGGLICYAMPAKQTLAAGAASGLAQSLARNLNAKDQSIGAMMAKVRNEVSKRSGGKQQIWFDFALEKDASAKFISSRKRNISTAKLPPTNPKPGDEWINGAGMVYCWCPPGRFKMGSPGWPCGL